MIAILATLVAVLDGFLTYRRPPSPYRGAR